MKALNVKKYGYSHKYQTRSGCKEELDPVCLTKKETRFIDNWLRKHEGRLLKKRVEYASI
jgi:hypothetical protein